MRPCAQLERPNPALPLHSAKPPGGRDARRRPARSPAGNALPATRIPRVALNVAPRLRVRPGPTPDVVPVLSSDPCPRLRSLARCGRDVHRGRFRGAGDDPPQRTCQPFDLRPSGPRFPGFSDNVLPHDEPPNTADLPTANGLRHSVRHHGRASCRSSGRRASPGLCRAAPSRNSEVPYRALSKLNWVTRPSSSFCGSLYPPHWDVHTISAQILRQACSPGRAAVSQLNVEPPDVLREVRSFGFRDPVHRQLAQSRAPE